MIDNKCNIIQRIRLTGTLMHKVIEVICSALGKKAHIWNIPAADERCGKDG